MTACGREPYEHRLAGHHSHISGDGAGSLDLILCNVERKEIINALQRAGGRRTLAARLLGISRSRLYRRMDALGILFEDPGTGRA